MVNVISFDNLFPGFPSIAGEVSDKAVNKGVALKVVCEYFGVSTLQSIAFGDSMNGTEMLLVAGIGVAMGNSSKQVTLFADQICKSCAENGVAKALDRFNLTG